MLLKKVKTPPHPRKGGRAEFVPIHRFEATKRLVKLYREPRWAGLIESMIEPDFDSEKAVEQCRRLIAAIANTQALQTDPYVMSGFAPSENLLSNAIANILDPMGRHYQGTLGLQALLDAASLLANTEQSCSLERIRVLLTTNTGRTTVSREHSFENGRIDLRITSPTFEILVENKMRGGAEVVINGKHQTIRYERLIEAAQSSGKSVIAIYLTPEGKRAASKKFVSVSCGQFAQSIKERLGRSPKQSVPRTIDSWVMLRAFALTYENLN